ncbi:hypothetical protein CQ054_02805 [Ochrobactrum sp. MYb29]|nr:hypothetical protein CQ054_02805 [Ochrobactrum sp. MYb29]
MPDVSIRNNIDLDFDLQGDNQGYISYKDRLVVESLDDLLIGDIDTLLNVEQPAPRTVPLVLVPESEIELIQKPIEGVLTPAELAIFEIEISKMATNELADFENHSSKMASGDSSHFWEFARAENTPKTPDLRASDDVLQSGPSLRNNITHHNTPKTDLKTPFTTHPKTGPKTQKTKNQKIAPKPTLFTLAQKEPLHTPDGVKPRPAQTTSFIKDLPDPFRRRWHDLTLNDKLALSFIETERHGGYSFRLTFSAKLAWKLLAASDPATVFCRDHLRPALKQEFGKVLPYSFRFEFSKDGTLHIHGAIVTPEMERTGIEERLRGVLNKAGGSIGTATQSYVAQIYDPLRYFYYLEKSAKETRNKMENNKKGITSISGEIKQLIKSLHESNRSNTKLK